MKRTPPRRKRAVYAACGLALLVLLLTAMISAVTRTSDRRGATGDAVVSTAGAMTGQRPRRAARREAAADAASAGRRLYAAGMVVDERARGIAAAFVRVTDVGDAASTVAQTATDDGGGFEVRWTDEHLTSFRLSASAPGFVTDTRPYDPSRCEAIRIALRPSAPLRIRVVEDNDAGAPGLSVRIAPVAAGSAAKFCDPQLTDRGGVARFEEAPDSGAVSVEIDHGNLTRFSAWRDPGQQELELRIGRCTELEGRVIDSETGAAVSDARLYLPWRELGSSGADGSFIIPRWYDRGSKYVMIAAHGYLPQEVGVYGNPLTVALTRGLTVSGRVVTQDWMPTTAHVELVAVNRDERGERMERQFAAESDQAGSFAIAVPETATEVVVDVLGKHAPPVRLAREVLGPGTIDLGQILIPEGVYQLVRVVDAQARGISGVRVDGRLRDINEPARRISAQEVAETDETGSVLVLCPSRGPCEFVAYLGGREIARAATDDEEMQPCVELRAVVHRQRILVRDAAGSVRGGVLLGARSSTGETMRFLSGPDGSGEVLSLLPASWTVRSIPGGLTSWCVRKTLMEGDVLVVEVERSIRIDGVVLDDAGNPRPGVMLAWAIRGAAAGAVRTDTFGCFTIDAPPGAWLQFECPGSASEREDSLVGGVDVVASTGTYVSIRCWRVQPRTVRVMVRDDSGRAMAGVGVVLSAASGELIKGGRTGAEGRVEFERVPGTKLRALIVPDGGAASASTVVDVPPGVSEVEVQVQRK